MTWSILSERGCDLSYFTKNHDAVFFAKVFLLKLVVEEFLIYMAWYRYMFLLLWIQGLFGASCRFSYAWSWRRFMLECFYFFNFGVVNNMPSFIGPFTCWLPSLKLTWPMNITIFPGKYHQNSGLSMAILVYRSVIQHQRFFFTLVSFLVPSVVFGPLL